MARGRIGIINNPKGINQYSMGMGRGGSSYKPRTTKVAVPVRTRGSKPPMNAGSTKRLPMATPGAVSYSRYYGGTPKPAQAVRVAQANRRHSRGARTLVSAAIASYGRAAS